MSAISDAAVAFAAGREGLRLIAYQDVGGVWTIGYGHTGREVIAGRKIDKDEAWELLRSDLKTAASRIAALVKAAVIADLTLNQYSALLSFVFNVGADAKWTIWKRLNARQFDQVPLELMKFVNVGDKKVQGLVNRRADEVKLWSTGEPGSTSETLSSHLTRTEATPPTPADPVPASRSAMMLTSVAGAVAAGPPMVNQAIQAVTPYAGNSNWVRGMLGVLAALGACLACTGLLLIYLQKKAARS